MADTTMTRFLDKLEQRARRDVAEHLALQRVGLPVVAAFIAAIGYCSITDCSEHTVLPWLAVLIALAAGAAGLGAGSWCATASQASLERMRLQVHSRLIDGGLLQLVLEPDPYDRLPSLQPLAPLLFGGRRLTQAAETLPAKLERFVQFYEDCSIEAGLVPGATVTAPQVPDRAQGLPAPLRRVIMLAALAIIMVGTILRSEPYVNQRGWIYGASLAAIVGGYVLMGLGQRPGATARSGALGQSALKTAAVRLELVELLRHRE